MFQDVDGTLRAVLMADVPIKKAEVEIAFDRPTRDWSSRLSKPTLNLFLFDVRERVADERVQPRLVDALREIDRLPRAVVLIEGDVPDLVSRDLPKERAVHRHGIVPDSCPLIPCLTRGASRPGR